jgi:hypothetical protein
MYFTKLAIWGSGWSISSDNKMRILKVGNADHIHGQFNVSSGILTLNSSRLMTAAL